MLKRSISLGLFLLTCAPLPSFACSSFMLSNESGTVSTKNFDWQWGHGLVIVNKRNLRKKAISHGSQALWTSKYGSVTFNQVSRELPQGGMNEAGLNVEVLWLGPATFPNPATDNRPTVSELQWAQYQLDNYGSTDEVIAHLNDLRIEKIASAVHYFICDSSARCATVDPMDGQYVAHSQNTLPYPILTNSAYQVSSEYAQEYIHADACTSVKKDYASVDRFARLACELSAPNESLTDHAFAALAAVAGIPGIGGALAGDLTQWSIVYNLKEKQITYFTDQSPGKKTIQLSGLNFSCRKPTQSLDLNTPSQGDVTTQFSDDTDAAELAIVQASADAFTHLPPPTIPALVKAANSSICKEQ